MIRGVTLDLDGTVYLGDTPVAGAAEYVQFLREKGVKILFVTNRANRLPSEIAEQLIEMGIECEGSDILTSSQATAEYLTPAPTYMIGEIGLEKELIDRGFELRDESVKYVIVSFDRSFTYKKMMTAVNLIYRGAEFIATNPDKGLPTEGGIHPGTGSIVAAIEAGCGKSPIVVGKPEPLILMMAAKKLQLPPGQILAIGDNITTDVPSGFRAGMATALIMTGISTKADVDGAPLKPTYMASDYTELRTLTERLIY